MVSGHVDSRKARNGRFIFEAIRESNFNGTEKNKVPIVGDVQSVLVRRKNIGKSTLAIIRYRKGIYIILQ